MRRKIAIILAALVGLALLELPFGGAHGDFAWSGIPGFFALFGLIGCVAIILISKWLGHHWLQRKENYYDRNNGDK